MKFDYVIGNPPYQYPKDVITDGANSKKLWRDILNRIFPLSNNISLVTPSTVRKILEKNSKHITYFDYTADHYFDVGVKIVAWNYNRERSEVGVTIDADGTQHVSKRFIELKKEKYVIIEAKLKKMAKERGHLLTMASLKLTEKQESPNDIMVYVNITKKKIRYSKPYKEAYCKKCIIMASKAYKRENVIYSSDPVGPLHSYFNTDKISLEELENGLDFIFSDLITKMAHIEREVKATGFVFIHNHLPSIDLSINYKNCSPYKIGKYIGLTKNDVDYILNYQLTK